MEEEEVLDLLGEVVVARGRSRVQIAEHAGRSARRGRTISAPVNDAQSQQQLPQVANVTVEELELQCMGLSF